MNDWIQDGGVTRIKILLCGALFLAFASLAGCGSDGETADGCNSSNPPAYCGEVEGQGECGDGDLGPDEECDTTVSNQTCGDLGFDAGSLFCTEECAVDSSDCHQLLRIRFDYRFDSNGYFDAAKRAILEESARLWSSRITEHFPPLPDNTKLRVVHPENPSGDPQDVTIPIWDMDLLIFVGAISTTTGGGATTWNYFYPHPEWTNTLYNALRARVADASKYEPFLVSMTFDTDRPYPTFVDPTPQSDDDIPDLEYDFLNLVVHELGHALGITSWNSSFEDLQEAGTYVGPAIALNNNVPVPMADLSHFELNYAVAGESLCIDPSSLPGERKLPTRFEHFVLEDLGYFIALE
ncbi:MAG: hypothetical protein A2289_06170 [Deltaproteobacteria bacterium RIFOXYA12_FULL_58_15]|nr:MAG: hypothetical protein A2289_06170 [Deltaproteobacteria bacterium RIFOXYA12_FULL_58_15]OGR09148.1 MAG: hypothetical protein A2341_02795 [Deltaproteobacteria bacterium RIFOXYB12_FULL_58_9]